MIYKNPLYCHFCLQICYWTEFCYTQGKINDFFHVTKTIFSYSQLITSSYFLKRRNRRFYFRRHLDLIYGINFACILHAHAGILKMAKKACSHAHGERDNICFFIALHCLRKCVSHSEALQNTCFAIRPCRLNRADFVSSSGFCNPDRNFLIFSTHNKKWLMICLHDTSD